MDIFVSNLPFEIGEQEITAAFAPFGTVAAVKMVFDKQSGRFRGMAFVTMEDSKDAEEIIAALNGKDLGGRPMRVDRSRPREQRFNGFGGGFTKNRKPFGGRRRFDSDDNGGSESGWHFRRESSDDSQDGNRSDAENGGDGFRPRKKFGFKKSFGGGHFNERRENRGFGGDSDGGSNGGEDGGDSRGFRPRSGGHFRPHGGFRKEGDFHKEGGFHKKGGFRKDGDFGKDGGEGGGFRKGGFKGFPKFGGFKKFRRERSDDQSFE